MTERKEIMAAGKDLRDGLSLLGCREVAIAIQSKVYHYVGNNREGTQDLPRARAIIAEGERLAVALQRPAANGNDEWCDRAERLAHGLGAANRTSATDGLDSRTVGAGDGKGNSPAPAEDPTGVVVHGYADFRRRYGSLPSTTPDSTRRSAPCSARSKVASTSKSVSSSPT